MNMKQSCKALICAIEGELDGRHCTEEQAAAILDHALPSLTEALARVEAERDTAIVQMQNIRTNRDRLNKQLGDAEFNLCIAHQQLADVLYILDQHRTWTGMGWEQLPVPVHAVEKIRSKLAQAEQQEAQVAQAGDDKPGERRSFERWYADRFGYGPADGQWNAKDSLGQYLIGSAEESWCAWQALATQPAEYPAGAIENGRALLDRLEQWYEFREAQGHPLANCAEWIEARQCFEQMAESLNAERGAEHE